jgi:hypothetical protein
MNGEPSWETQQLLSQAHWNRIDFRKEGIPLSDYTRAEIRRAAAQYCARNAYHETEEEGLPSVDRKVFQAVHEGFDPDLPEAVNTLFVEDFLLPLRSRR